MNDAGALSTYNFHHLAQIHADRDELTLMPPSSWTVSPCCLSIQTSVAVFFSMTRTEPRPVWTTVLPHTVRAPLTTQPEAGRPWSGDPRDLLPDSLDVKDGDGLEVAAPTCPNTGKPASPSWTSGQRHQASQGSGHACPFSSPLSAPCTSRSIPLAARDPLLCQLGDPSLSRRSKPGPRPPRGPLLSRWRPA